MIYKCKPILTPRLWGGYKLSSIFKSEKDKFGEAWILSCLGDNNSIIDKNLTLKDIFLKDKNIVKKGYQGEFPILIKLIDAQDDLSIQVHPSVKTEFWHILNKVPSKLYMGLKKDTNRNEIEEVLRNGDITDELNYIDVSNGDSYLINPGTIHAIGKGTFLIEIQQSADVTYRLYDFDRLDKNGNKRELHITQALDVINYNHLDINKSNSTGLLVDTPFFKVNRIDIEKEEAFTCDESSFNSITIIDGNGVIKTDNQSMSINEYDTVFIPAGEGTYTLKGKMTIILVRL